MFRSRKRRTFIALLTVLALLMSGVATFAAGSNVTITGYNAPSSITKGKGFSIKGTISSDTKIKRVEIGIAKSKGKWTSYKYDNKKVNSKSFNIKKADKKLKFGRLSTGTYYYRIYAHTSDGMCHTVLNQPFTVTKKGSSGGGAGASTSNVRYPSTLVQGKGFSVSGKIKSSKKIKSVTAGVVNAGSDSWTSVKATKKSINSKSFNLAKLDSKLKFGTLSVGEYKYRITVTTTKGTSTVVDSYFTVTTAPAEPATTAATAASATAAVPAPAATSAPAAAALQVINSKPVTIAHAAHGEKGTSGCKAGDQTGSEVCTRKWTYSSKSSSGFHWNVVLRCNNPNVAAEIAKTAEAACKNNHIGYDKGTVASRQSFYKALVAANWDASAITTDVETSCSPFACACINAGFKSQYIKTDHSCTTLAKTLRNDPMFTYLTADEYCKSYKYLMPGDILITTGHHCAIVVK